MPPNTHPTLDHLSMGSLNWDVLEKICIQLIVVVDPTFVQHY